MQLLRRLFHSSREKDKKRIKKTITMAKADRRRSSFLATDPMKRLTNFFGSSSSEEDVKQQTLAVATTAITTSTTVTAATAATATTGNSTETTTETTTTAPTTQIHSSQQTVQVGVQVPLTPPIPPKENLLALPESLASVGVNGRQNAPRLSISLPSPAPTKTIHDIGESLTPPMSGSNQNYGALSPNLQPVSVSPHPISPITSPGGGNRNFSGASYASYATTSSRPSSSHMNFPVAPSPAPSEAARGSLRRKRRSGGGFFGKKKRDDVDCPTAWRLTRASTEHLEEYNYAPLAKGEPVPDMWDDQGDTLVFLAPRNVPNPKFTAPSFRMSSTPLLFLALGQYVEDTQYGSQDEVTSPGGTRLEPDDLFLDVPTGVPQRSSSQNFSRPGTPTAATDPVTVGEGQEAANGGSPPPPELSRDARFLDQTGRPEATIYYKVYYPALEFGLRPSSPPKDGKGKKHKHSNSVTDETIQRLIDARNLFAFLNCNFLVGTADREMPFQILLKTFEMIQGPASPTLRPEGQLDTNGLSKAVMAESNFLYYVETLKIDDLRNDDDAIVEALILAERWNCSLLYHEGFVHACGRWEEIKDHSGFALVSERTKKRLDRASIEMHNVRIASVLGRLSNFDYPSIFTGDGKYPEYKPWRLAFDAMRKHTLSYYKHVYGSWPPRAGKRGKGGGYTETGGLNRVVLQKVYNDFSALYDLVVDREWIHGERIHFETLYGSDGDDVEAREKEESARTTIRKIQHTYDESGVPVQPSMPFDLPRLPYIPATPPPTANRKPAKKSKSKASKKLKGEELSSVLRNSYNQDSYHRQPANEFAEMFKQLEKEFGNGKTIEDLMDARRGRWLFIYCVCQSLPLVVVDAPGVRYSDGVEYFLCKNLKGPLPWQKASNRRISRLSGIWVPGPGGLLSVPGSGQNGVDAGDDEIEYVYRKGHCWTVAEKWRMVSGPAVEDLEAVELEGGEDPGFLAFQQSLMDGGADTGSPDMSPGVTTPQGTELSPPPFHGAYSGIDDVVGAERNSIQYYNPNNQVPQSPQDQIWAGQPVPANAQDLYLVYQQQQELLRQQFEQQLQLQQQRQSYPPAPQAPPPKPPTESPQQYSNSFQFFPPQTLRPLQMPDETTRQYQPLTQSPNHETVPRTQEEFTRYRQAHFEQFQRQRQASPSPPPIRLSSEDPAGSPSLTPLPGSPMDGKAAFTPSDIRPVSASPPQKAHTWSGQFDPLGRRV
ncbi:hypothetical protein L873DRAFT_1922969 [Choiromyces venosus 120613-1]|uniref:DUF8004 domain-containing protein n=1 Tax=Choiromyces venosus 120613-1 TaxID=1336337 RepID=A0A3N4JIP3_9PEZI|nr:hypothetical protein L873DRAFT_1922969 [Choiromyces venosus 120613-1]